MPQDNIVRGLFDDEQIIGDETFVSQGNVVSGLFDDDEENNSLAKITEDLTPEEVESEKEGFWDSMPLVYKQAYNESLGGMMHEIMTGKKYYDISSAPPSMKRDLAAGLLSFFASKEDLGLMAATLGTGTIAKGVVQKTAGKQIVSALSKKRAQTVLTRGGKLSKEQAEQVIDDVANIGIQQATLLGAHDGLYKAAREVRDDIIMSGNDERLREKKEFKGKEGAELWGAAMKEVLKVSDPKDYAKGFGLGILGGTARTGRWFLRGPHTQGSQPAGFMFEGLAFGAAAPVVYEGRAPGWADIIMSAGIVGALSLPGSVTQKIRGAHQGKLSKEFDKAFERKMRKDVAEKEARKQPISMVPLVDEAGPVIKGVDVALEQKLKDAGKKGPIPKTELNARNLDIVADSIKWKKDGTVTFDVKVGRGPGKGPGSKPAVIRLDAKNSMKVLEHYVEDPRAYRELVKRQGPTKGKKFERVRLTKLVESWENKSKGIGYGRGFKGKSREGLTKKDWDEGIQSLINAGNTRLKKLLNKKGEITSKDLTPAEKAMLGRRIDDAKKIRLSLEKYYPEYNKLSLHNHAAVPNSERGVFSKMFSWLKPGYDAVDDLYAKKAIRMLEETDMGARHKTSERYRMLDELFGIADNASSANKAWFKDWYSGVNTGDSAFTWFSTMATEARKLDPGKQKAFFTKAMKAEELKLKKLTGEALEKQQLKVDFLKGWKKYTDSIYEDAKMSGINVASYVDFYVPNMIRKPILDILFQPMKEVDDKISDLLGAGIVPNMDGYSGELQKNINREIRAIVEKFDKKVKAKGEDKNSFSAIFKKLEEQFAREGRKPDEFEVIMAMKQGFHNNTEKVFAPLERSRTLGKSGITTNDFNATLFSSATELFEKDLARLGYEYTAGSTKRIEMAKAFGANYEFLNHLIAKIDPTKKIAGINFPGFKEGRFEMKTLERTAVETQRDIFLGDVNFKNPLLASKIFQTAANLEMTFKIASGFAVIPNLTQVMISTMLKSPMSAMKATVDLAINSSKGNQGSIRQWVQDSGAVIMTAFDDMLSSNPNLQTGAAAKLLDKTPTGEVAFKLLTGKGEMHYRDAISFMAQKSAKWSGFQKINEVNNLISAATAEQLMVKFSRIIKGNKTGLGILDSIAPNQRRKWAIDQMKKMGISEKEVLKYGDNIINRKYDMNSAAQRAFRKKVMRGMSSFAVDTQQQRSFIRDPFIFNDPVWKSMFLFKRFGYRQAQLVKREVTEQLAYGNVMPLLQLAAGGFLGGQFVMWAKDQYQKILTGEEQYFGKRNRAKLLTMDSPNEIGWNDLVNAYSNVGALGVLGDVLSDEDPMDAIDFFITPVIADDIFRMWDSVGEVWDGYLNDYDSLNTWDIPLRKGAKKLSPMFGGIPSRFVRKTLETEEMTRDRIMGYRREQVEYIRDLIEQGRMKQVFEQIEAFNKTYGYYEIERLGLGYDNEEGLRIGTAPLKDVIPNKWILRDESYLGYPSMLITPEDFNANVMFKRYIKKLEKDAGKKERTWRP